VFVCAGRGSVAERDGDGGVVYLTVTKSSTATALRAASACFASTF
jgi:hypothetical protein